MKRNIFSLWFAIVCFAFSAWNGSSQGLITPPSTITGLTHRSPVASPFASPIISDRASSNQFVQTGFTTTLTGMELIVASFEAPSGQMFLIHAAPDGFGEITLSLSSRWVGSITGGGSLSPTSFSAIFENLNGDTPSLISSANFIDRGTVRFSASFTVAPGTSFTGIQLSALYSSSLSSPAQQIFAPDALDFIAAASSSGSLEDGILMSLEVIPEPSAFALILLGFGGVLFFSKTKER